MSAANDAPDEVCPETKKFPKQGTMLREFAYGSPRRERRHPQGRQHAVRARAPPRRRKQQHPQGQRRHTGTKASHTGNGSIPRGAATRHSRTLPTPRRATLPAAGNKDAPPHHCCAAGRRGRNRIRRAVNRACYFISTSECPVISAGCSRPISLSTVGATSARMPL